MDKALASLCDNGLFQKADEGRILEKYGFHGKCYRLLSLK